VSTDLRSHTVAVRFIAHKDVDDIDIDAIAAE
jgi:hypothetical protein